MGGRELRRREGELGRKRRIREKELGREGKIREGGRDVSGRPNANMRLDLVLYRTSETRSRTPVSDIQNYLTLTGSVMVLLSLPPVPDFHLSASPNLFWTQCWSLSIMEMCM